MQVLDHLLGVDLCTYSFSTNSAVKYNRVVGPEIHSLDALAYPCTWLPSVEDERDC
jgi:hypothetical protein